MPIPEIGLPSWIDPEAFEAWKQMRLKKRVPWSDRCHKRALKRLQDLKDKGHDPNQALCDSEFYGWLDLYPPKPREVSPSAVQASESYLADLREHGQISQAPEAIKAREACRAALKVVGK